MVVTGPAIYNHERPHSSLAHRTPAQFAALEVSPPESAASAPAADSLAGNTIVVS